MKGPPGRGHFRRLCGSAHRGIACADPDDALACHYAAIYPKRHPCERLSTAVDRTDLAFRAATAHQCELAATGRFWAIYGFLTPTGGPVLPPRGQSSAPTAAE